MKLVHYMLINKCKCHQKFSKSSRLTLGFTLVELLIGLVISFLIITPLLTFMISILNAEKQEHAKATSEDEIQLAINYIARDLQQAIYIYDAEGIEAIKSELRYPNDINKTPILVFWKRDFVNDVISTGNVSEKDDTFVYSLIVYYIDNSTSNIWSKAARISRWNISDGVQSLNGVTCAGLTKKYVNNNCPDEGFAPFNDYFTETDTLNIGMKKWKKASARYTNDAIVLIDFVDQSTSSPPPAICPPNISDPNNDTKNIVQWSLVKPERMTGFYVCVDSINNSAAQVFIRGNALAILRKNPSQINYSQSKKTYFSSINVKVQGRGFVYK